MLRYLLDNGVGTSYVLPPQQGREEKNRLDKRETKQEGSLPDCLKAEGARRSPPPGFEVTKVLQEWAAKNYPSVSIVKETAKFILQDFPGPCSNWDNKWKRWIIGAEEYQKKQNGLSGELSSNEKLLQLAELMGIEKRFDESDANFRDRAEKANDQRIIRDL